MIALPEVCQVEPFQTRTVTDAPEAFATSAVWLSGVNAHPRGDDPTVTSVPAVQVSPLRVSGVIVFVPELQQIAWTPSGAISIHRGPLPHAMAVPAVHEPESYFRGVQLLDA